MTDDAKMIKKFFFRPVLYSVTKFCSLHIINAIPLILKIHYYYCVLLYKFNKTTSVQTSLSRSSAKFLKLLKLRSITTDIIGTKEILCLIYSRMYNAWWQLNDNDDMIYDDNTQWQFADERIVGKTLAARKGICLLEHINHVISVNFNVDVNCEESQLSRYQNTFHRATDVCFESFI